MKKNNLIYINSAEAIIEPFWDKQLCELKEWNVEGMIETPARVKSLTQSPGTDWWEEIPESLYSMDENSYIRTNNPNGLLLKSIWCNLSFEWAGKAKGKALSMHRDFDVDCTNYDWLLLSCILPEQSELTLTAHTDRGILSKIYAPFSGLKKEYELELGGALKINRITIELTTQKEGAGFGSFSWIGLQNRERLIHHRNQFNNFDSQWYPYLKPETYQAKINPQYGFLFDKKELKRLQEKHKDLFEKTADSPFLQNKDEWCLEPESRIDEFVMMGADTRYRRERNYGNRLLLWAEEILTAAALTHDNKLLRLAARYAMSLAFCRHVDDGMITAVPGSSFEHKAFVASQTARALVLILDIAGDWFTRTGRDYILRRINEECLGKINARILKYSEKPEEIFKMNQLILFSEGRILGYLALENHYKRSASFTEIVMNDIKESLGLSINKDGSYTEGPGYFSHIGSKVPQYYLFYAHQRGLNFRESLPRSFLRTGEFAQLIASTDREKVIIPLCDTREDHLAPNFFPLMAYCLPQTHWADLYAKASALNKQTAGDIFALKLLDNPLKGEPLKALIYMEDIKIAASHRKWKGEWVKILTQGNKAHAGHNHEDKGSFVLEFAGDTYAMDPGTCDYHLEAASFLKCAQVHNMLVPFGTDTRPAPVCPLPHDIVPNIGGDEQSFFSEIELSKGWEKHYKKWTRTISSPSPEIFIITDDYKLLTGKGVEFLWNTQLPITEEGDMLKIEGEKSYILIERPEQCRSEIRKIPLYEKRTFNQISFLNPLISGNIEVKAQLFIK